MKPQTWTIKELSKMYNIPETNLRRNARALGFTPTSTRRGGYFFKFDRDEMISLINYQPKKPSIEVIYVNTTYWIIESKMNYETI